MRSTAQGTAYETQIVNFLKETGYPYARRRAKAGRRDEGDISLGDAYALTLEAKAQRAWRIGEWVDQAVVEGRHVGGLGLLVLKRWNHPVAQSFVIGRLMDVAPLLDHVRRVGHSGQ